MTIVRDKDPIFAHTGLYGDFFVDLQERVVALDGNKILGFYEINHELEILLFGMPPCVNIEHFVVDDVRTISIEFVGETLDTALITGNDRGGKYYGVSGLYPQKFMLFVDDAHQYRAGLSLCTGSQDDYFVRRMVFDLLHGDNCICFELHVAELEGYLDVGAHGSSLDNYFFIVFFGELDNLLETSQKRGKCPYNEPPPNIFKNFVDLEFNLFFAKLMSGFACIGTIRHEYQDIFFPQGFDLIYLGLAGDIGFQINLEIPRVYYDADRCMYDDAHGSRDIV